MNSTIASDARDDLPLAPGDFFIDTTNITLFQVMDYYRFGCASWRIAEALSITHDQVLIALDYIQQHPAAIEADYQANTRAAAQRLVHRLVGSYRPVWQDRIVPFGGIGIGIIFSMIGVIIARQFLASKPVDQTTFGLLTTALLTLFCCVVGIGMVVLGSRLLIDSLSLRYVITDVSLTTTRYGGISAYSIPLSTVVDASLQGQFLHFACEDGKTYRMLALRNLLDAINAIPVSSSSLDSHPPS